MRISRPSPAMVVACLALLIAVGGTATAARTRIRSVDIAPGAVTAKALGKNAVRTKAIADGSVTTSKLAAGAVTTATVADGAITAAKLGSGSSGRRRGRRGLARRELSESGDRR